MIRGFGFGQTEWTHPALAAPATGELAYTYAYRLTYTRQRNIAFLYEASPEPFTIFAPEVLPPGRLENFRVSSISATTVRLEWEHHIAAENHYDTFELKRTPDWTSGPEWKDIGFMGTLGVDRAYDDTDVSSGTDYTYQVRAVNNTDCSDPINSATVAVSTTGGTVSRLAISDASVSEGNLGDTPVLQFSLSMDVANGTDISFDYATADDGSANAATAGVDYTAVSGTRTLPAGTTSTMIDVPVIGDNDAEASETLSLNLSNLSSNAFFGRDSGTGTITDDDTLRTTVGLVLDANANEGDGNMVFQVWVTTGTGLPTPEVVTFDYATSDSSTPDTAREGEDYVATSSIFTVPAGTADGAFLPLPVPLIDDSDFEGDETFVLGLSNRSPNSRWGSRVATGTISDND